MAHKTKDAPRKLYTRSNIAFICYAGAYWAPELRADSDLDAKGDQVTISEVKEGDELVALEVTQGTVVERLTRFEFERTARPRKGKTNEGSTESTSTETVGDADADPIVDGDDEEDESFGYAEAM